VSEAALREQIALHGESLFQRGYGCGASGNISALLDDGLLVTPTNSCLGRLDPARIAKLGPDGAHLSGDPPSKEAFLHLAMYQERPDARAIVHLHSTHSVAVSCLADVDPTDVLPPITAYYVMRIGKLPLVPYYRPGDKSLAEAVRTFARDHHAVLLANHGPVVAGKALDAAVYAAEELEETAKLHLLMRGSPTRPLNADQVAELRRDFAT
jgi:ribulose-5-phosphate 4-epimerase/fuculose-1-phosphate aldolase